MGNTNWANTLVDRLSGEKFGADADTMERVTGVEIGYIDWMLEKDGKFENRDQEVQVREVFSVYVAKFE